MAKNLNSVLTTLRKKNVFVKIGSVGGSAFWYCERLTINSLEQIGKVNLKYATMEQKLYDNLLWQYKNLDKHYEIKLNAWLKNPRNAKKSEAQKKMFENQLKVAKEFDKRRLPITLKELEYDLSLDFTKRPVVEIVDGISPDEPNTKVIYVKGFEKGNYWTIKEYKKAHLPKDQQNNFNVRLPRLAEMESK